MKDAAAIRFSISPSQLPMVAVSSNMNWKVCIICQTNSSEEPHCPSQSLDPEKRPPLDVYESFLDNVEEFRKLNSFPVDPPTGEQETAQNFVEKNASWHKRCHQKFNSSMLERTKQKLLRKRKCKSKESEHVCRPKHQTTGTQPTACIFCETEKSERLQEIITFNMDKSVRDGCPMFTVS